MLVPLVSMGQNGSPVEVYVAHDEGVSGKVILACSRPSLGLRVNQEISNTRHIWRCLGFSNVWRE